MLANGVKETTTTTGTGTVTLSAVTGFPRFANVLSVGQFVDYAIQDGNSWEWGVGKVAASNTLERVVVTAKYESGTYSKNPTTKLSLSGSATVFATAHDGSFGIGSGGNSANSTKNVVPPANIVNVVTASQFGYTFPVANRVVAFPWVWPDGIDRYATGLRVNVITASGTKCRIAIVALGDANGSAKIVAQTNDIDISTTGAKTSTFASPIALPLKRYLMCVVCDGTPVFTASENSTADPYGYSAAGSVICAIAGWRLSAGWSSIADADVQAVYADAYETVVSYPLIVMVQS